MAELARSNQAFYLHRLPAEHAEATLRGHKPFRGKTRRARFARGEGGDWQVVAALGELPQGVFFDLASAFLGGGDDEDFNLEQLAGELEVPADAVVAVRLAPGDPAGSFYALFEDNDDFEVVFSGRREDGKGVRFDVVEESVLVQRESRRFALSIVEYLRGRGVPDALLPGPNGIEFEAVSRYEVLVNVE